MPPPSRLTGSPPYALEHAVKRLGVNLRTARLRRNLSLQAMSEKLGVGRDAIADAEQGKLTTGIAVYVGLLWAMDLLQPFHQVADPALDEEGTLLARAEEREHAYPSRGLGNDF